MSWGHFLYVPIVLVETRDTDRSDRYLSRNRDKNVLQVESHGWYSLLWAKRGRLLEFWATFQILFGFCGGVSILLSGLGYII